MVTRRTQCIYKKKQVGSSNLSHKKATKQIGKEEETIRFIKKQTKNKMATGSLFHQLLFYI